MPSILVTGGAGYIGSHACHYMREKGVEVVVVDNLGTGFKSLVRADHFYELDIRETYRLAQIMEDHKVQAVVHFAASSLVGESMEKPYEYYHNNVYGMMSLLEAMKKAGVDKIVFSSSAAVYGQPETSPIEENARTEPTNPYGETKLIMENMMKWFDKAYGIEYVSLRYFNAAGASKDGTLGELHDPETHLIPLVLQVAQGKREEIFIFGDDYPTDDGTCIRDYIHVMDLAQAHYLALKHLAEGGTSQIFNLGNGKGYSVLEIIETARKLTGHPIPARVSSRRPGDPPSLVASSLKAKDILGWSPVHASLEEIIGDAWNFYKQNTRA